MTLCHRMYAKSSQEGLRLFRVGVITFGSKSKVCIDSCPRERKEMAVFPGHSGMIVAS